MLSRSFQILGLPSTASLAQIKKAYRNKAKQLHPDRNASLNAHAQFTALSEAYDYLVAYKSGRLSSRRPTRARSTASGSRRAQEDRRRAESHARAQAHAKMKYSAYQKTEHFKDSVAIEAATEFLTFILSAVILIILPFLALYNNSIRGMWVCFIVILVSFPLWLDVLRRPSNYLKFSELKDSWSRIAGFEGVQTVGSLLVNGLLFCLIGLSTLIPLESLTATLGVAAVAGYAYAYFSSRWDYRWFYGLGLGPFIVLFTLLTNYVGSHSPVREQYAYTQERERDQHGHVEKKTLITLKDDAYEEYSGIRFFMNQSALGSHQHIAYTFEEGLLGWRVMTDFDFIR